MRVTVLTLLVALLPTVSGAWAGDAEKAVATCAAVKGDLARLECFDQLARRMGLAGPRDVPAKLGGGVGKWSVSRQVNPIDDSTTVTLVLMAESGTSRFGKQVGLVARCQSNKTELYINWQHYLGSEASVTSRVGQSGADTRDWSLSTDKQATFYPRSPIGFLKALAGSDRFVAQVTPYNESPVTAVFDTQGLSEALKPLRETCGW